MSDPTDEQPSQEKRRGHRQDIFVHSLLLLLPRAIANHPGPQNIYACGTKFLDVNQRPEVTEQAGIRGPRANLTPT
jgi:hypothetical protein